MSQKRRSFLMTMGSLALADDETGRPWRQLTSGRANSYPLYYFIPSMTADSRYLIFHSERTGWAAIPQPMFSERPEHLIPLLF